MIDAIRDREIKACCATFYQSDIVQMLLGDVLHPGGLALTQRLGQATGLSLGDHVLDVACGRGASAVHLAEMARVLRAGGGLGLTDVTVSGPLPDDAQSLLAWVAYVAGAGAPENYVEVLQAVVFVDFIVEDQQNALLGLVNDVRRKLLAVELVSGLGKLNLGGLDLSEAKRLALRALELIEEGAVGYTLITATRE